MQTRSNKQINHLAFIMDGNRRWAKQRALPAIAGHKQGVDALKKLVQYGLDHQIDHLTVYAFSTENWKRENTELDFLFKLLSEVALSELAELKKLGVKVDFFGEISKFTSFNIEENLRQLESETAVNSKLNLHIALNYGAMDEISNALNHIQDTGLDIENMTEDDFSSSLYSSEVPDPELLIRTGGEKRLSNFLLWQSANSELIFTDTLWPDFSGAELDQILEQYLIVDSRVESLSA